MSSKPLAVKIRLASTEYIWTLWVTITAVMDTAQLMCLFVYLLWGGGAG